MNHEIKITSSALKELGDGKVVLPFWMFRRTYRRAYLGKGEVW